MHLLLISQRSIVRASYSFGGHLNQATFLKNCAYWGPREEYVVSGGDQGIVWIWDRFSGRVANLVKADETVCSGTAPRPYLPWLASYGVESTVRVWCVGGEAHSTKGSKMLAKRDEVIESNLRRVMTPLGRRHGQFCKNAKAFRQRARYMRSPDGCPWGGPPSSSAYLPNYVSDYTTPTREWGAEMMAALQREKGDGNEAFKKGLLIKASECYLKALRYLRAWSESGKKNGTGGKSSSLSSSSSAAAAVKQVEPLIAGLDLKDGKDKVVTDDERVALEVSCYLNLAACRLQQKDYKDAWRLANMAVDLQPQNAKALFRRGCAAMEISDLENAVADLTEVSG